MYNKRPSILPIYKHNTTNIMSDFIPNPTMIMEMMREDPKILGLTVLAFAVVAFLVWSTLSAVSGTNAETSARKKKPKKKSKKEYERLIKKKEQQKAKKMTALKEENAPAPAPAKVAVNIVEEHGTKGKNKKKNKNKNDKKKDKKKVEEKNIDDDDDFEIVGLTKEERKRQQQRASKAAAAEKMFKKLQAAADTANTSGTTVDADGWSTKQNKKAKKKKSKTTAPTAGGRVIPGSVAAVQQQIAPRQVSAPAPPPNDEVELSVLVEAKVISGIIGTGGATLKKIRDSTGATIEIPPKSSGGSRGTSRVTVTIKGTREEAVEAKKIIQSIAKKGWSAVLSSSGSNEEYKEHTSRIPTSSVHEIIGPGGKIIDRIKEVLNVQIKVAENKEKLPMTKVMIFGPLASVDKTRDVIKNICENHYDTLTHPGFSHIPVHLNSSSEMGLIIGVRGSQRKHIEQMSKCRIFIPERGTANELTIQVVGPAQGLKLANKMIQGILNKREEEQKQWEERREKEQEAEENGENPDLLDIDPECLQYLKPSSKMVDSLDIN